MASSMPSLRTVAKLALGGAQVLLGSGSRVLGGPSMTCSSPQLSCHNTTAVTDLCCFNSPGGQMLQTQFWDTHPTVGPVDSWTLHGLWPDHCDGNYDKCCDRSRFYNNITSILQHFGKTELLSYMSTYWKPYQGSDETFWKHEWDKHGTCINTMKPECYADHVPTQEVADYFQKAVDLFKELPSYQWLAEADIVPSTTATYSADAIQAALSAKHGHPVTIICKSSALKEIWYHYGVRGSVQTGEFVATEPDGMKSECPSDGVRYLPKNPSHTPTGGATLTTATRTTSTAPTATGQPFQGRGYLNVIVQDDANTKNGCIISKGTWYTMGTCATFTGTASADGQGFTLKSSKGLCAVGADGAFECASTVSTGTVFNATGSHLKGADGVNWFAKAVPSKTVQATVYAEPEDVKIRIEWQGM
ncbi:Ribonuclease T2 precursor (RNase T2) [Coniosporium apollinis]|uniref:Ribonuclease T2-like n=2 Tax=Coniosporium TaxID=2810619 RepID=A0ABQ9NWJ4_9PEZI|nr:Ribonuclease T2 precursor (RNase T2) [Cladosporium sp. JES 115]KAJ9666477.1 Ribonuclease T2 precursor (RNase T2) [Coniosporium apollinis]